MEKYEVNVLTRKGGWKKLSEELTTESSNFGKSNKSSNQNNNLKISINDQVEHADDHSSIDLNNKFKQINEVINELQLIESKKEVLFEKLSVLEKSFDAQKQEITNILKKTTKEYELYENAINLINSIKNI